MSEDFEAPKDDLDKELPTGREEHSDYKPADAKDANVKHQLSGMYQNWFLDYASYVILERAVPHIMDGLKPVQRRILHSMRRMEDGRYNKVANIVGHTMQFHPHGDASIGDALVQLGQKDLLVDCQGNWGNILTGDSAAAPRYIEARLSKFALVVREFPFGGFCIKSQNHRMETLLRRTKQRAGDTTGKISTAACARRGGHRRRPVVQDIAAQLQ